MKRISAGYVTCIGLIFLALFAQARPLEAQQAEAPELIRSIEFEGVSRLDPEALRNRIRSRVGAPFDPQTLSDDIGRLYALGEFESPGGAEPPISVRTERLMGGGVRLRFKVTERRILISVEIIGVRDLKGSEIRDSVRSKIGEVYDKSRVRADKKRLETALKNKGFLFARVTAETTAEAGVALQYLVSPGPEVVIDAVRFEGVTLLDDPDDLVELAAFDSKPETFWGLGEEGLFVKEKLDADQRKLVRYYRSQGYLDASVTLGALDFDGAREHVTIRLIVDEGKRYTVRRVRLRGNQAFSREELRPTLKLRPGRPFLGNDLLGDLDNIKKLYATRAYIHAQARFEVVYDRERKMLDVIYNIKEGPKVEVERIVFEGNEKTKDRVIRRNLSIYPGQPFNGAKLEESLGRLGRLRYFDDIKLDFRPGSEPGREDLVLKLSEARTGSFVIGGGISTNAGFFGNIVLNQRNFDILSPPRSFEDVLEGRAFTGGGQNFTLSAQPGRERSQYRASFTDPYFLDTKLIFGLDAFIFDRIRPDYREGRVGGGLSLGYRIYKDLVLRGSYRLEQVRLFDFDFDAIPDAIRASGNNLVSGPELALVIDHNFVDTQFVQYAGYGFRLSYEVLGGPFGGDVTLSRARLSANWQTTLLDFPKGYKWVFGARGQLGWQEAYGADTETPIFERFFAGGVRSFRGFEFRSIGPRDGLRSDEPTGGDLLALGTVDFSFPLYQRFMRGVLFIDGGTVESDLDDFSFRRVRLAAGFGFRVNVAIFPAPIALDFAFPIRSRRIDDEQVFSFSIGVGF